MLVYLYHNSWVFFFFFIYNKQLTTCPADANGAVKPNMDQFTIVDKSADTIAVICLTA